MGREWLYWVGGGIIGRPSTSTSTSTRRRRSSSSSSSSAAGNGLIKQDQDHDTTSPGCMCAVFHLFDLHHHLPLNHSPFLQQEQHITTTCKGVEAPRNSLEMEEEPPAAAKEEENLNFPVGIQIKTKTKRGDDLCAVESSMDSPGTKTPSLVARLMGLDLLPETNSPSFSSKSQTNHRSTTARTRTRTRTRTRSFYDDDIIVGARSLPATPRVSSARRSDVDYHHHRLSLQIINKENTNEEFAKITTPRFRQHQQQDENRSPGHYAKQILKQVKETVSRRVGQDITNTTTTTTEELIRRDQNLLIKISRKKSTANHTKQSTTSPKLRILDTNNRPLAETATKSPRNSSTSNSDVAPNNIPNPSKPKHQPVTQQHQPPHKEINKTGKKYLSPKTCDQAIRKKKEDAFVRSPAAAANKVDITDRKSPLSSELLHLSGPTILPVKKGPSPPATKLPQKQVSDALSSKRNTQLSSNTSRSYKQQLLPLPLPLQLHPDKIFTAPDTTNGCATTSAAADYECYINKILKRAGIIDKFTPLTLGKWHTPSHPLDPSIFYYLELFHPAAAPSAAVLSCRCNRKLIFQLVDEILADKLRPHLDYKPWISPAALNADHLGLLDDLCRKIEGFPAVDCQVLEDIDFLIERDLRKAALSGYYEEEGERLVREIEGEIVERLVSETVAVAVAEGVRTEREKRWMSRGEVSVSRDEMP